MLRGTGQRNPGERVDLFYAYHALGELVAVIIAGCVLLEYGVAAGAVAVGWSGYFNELIDSLVRLAIARRALGLADPGHRRRTDRWA